MTHHILLAIDSLVGRGAEKIVSTLCSAFIKSGCLVTLVIYEDIIEYPLDEEVLLLHLNPEPRRGPRILENRIHRRNAGRFLLLLREAEAKQGPIGLIVSNLPRMDKILSFIRDKRLYFVVHNTLSIQNGFHKKPWYRHISRILHAKRVYDRKQIVAVSDGVGDDLINKMRVSPQSIRTIYNPVDFETIRGLASQNGEEIPKDFIVHVGAYSLAHKCQDFIIRSFAKSGLVCTLVLIGKGKDEAEIRRVAHEEGVADRVLVAGFKQNPYAWMQRARFMVLGSAYEGLPTVVIESLVVGTPVLSTDCKSGPREILVGEMSRGLVPVGDVEAMALKMREFYDNPPAVDTQSLERFTTKAAVDGYISLLES